MKLLFTSTLILQTTTALSQQTDSVLNSMADQYNNYTDTTVYDCTLNNESGNAIKLSEFRGKIVLLNFWYTGCEPCIGQIPFEKKLHRRIGKRYKDLAWINISTDRNAVTWREFLKKKSMPGENTIAEKADNIESLFHVDEYPTFILINRAGQIIGHNIANADELKGVLLEYLIYRGMENIKSGDALREFIHQEPIAKKFFKKRAIRLLL